MSCTINFAPKQRIVETKEKFSRDYRIKIGDTIRNGICERKGYSQAELAGIIRIIE